MKFRDTASFGKRMEHCCVMESSDMYAISFKVVSA